MALWRYASYGQPVAESSYISVQMLEMMISLNYSIDLHSLGIPFQKCNFMDGFTINIA